MRVRVGDVWYSALPDSAIAVVEVSENGEKKGTGPELVP